MSIFIINNTKAAVWKNKNEWNFTFQKKYEKSIKKIKKNILIDKSSKYYGLNSDCADLAYLIRAIFAKENNLPFKIFNNNKVKLSNLTKKFDHIKNKNERFKAFMKRIFHIKGTKSLKEDDTYALDILKIRPGDIYHYEIIKNNNKIRHSMIIRDIHKNGKISFLYSTQAIAKNNQLFFKNEIKKAKNIIIKNHQTVYYLPNELSGGFRRFKIKGSEKDSNEQISIAKKGIKFFQKYLHKSLGKTENNDFKENPKNICNDMKERLKIVNEARNYIDIKKECLNYAEYDAYSTPVRDQELQMKITNLTKNIPNDFCKLKIDNTEVSLKKIIDNFKKNKISSDPYQPIKSRWGLAEEVDHNCKMYY